MTSPRSNLPADVSLAMGSRVVDATHRSSDLTQPSSSMATPRLCDMTFRPGDSSSHRQGEVAHRLTELGDIVRRSDDISAPDLTVQLGRNPSSSSVHL